MERKHSWFLEHVEVTNMKTEQVWLFPCNKWLSMYIKEPTLKRVLRAHVKDVEYRGMTPAPKEEYRAHVEHNSTTS